MRSCPGFLFNVVFDAVGKMEKSGKKALKERGIHLNVNKDSGGMDKAKNIRKDLITLKEICEAGKFKSVIDRGT